MAPLFSVVCGLSRHVHIDESLQQSAISNQCKMSLQFSLLSGSLSGVEEIQTKVYQ